MWHCAIDFFFAKSLNSNPSARMGEFETLGDGFVGEVLATYCDDDVRNNTRKNSYYYTNHGI